VSGRAPAPAPVPAAAFARGAAGTLAAEDRDARGQCASHASLNPLREHIRGIDGTGNEALPARARAADVGDGLAGLTRAGDLLGYRSGRAPHGACRRTPGSRGRSLASGMGSKR
jgi:hypothetical protein